MPQDFTSLPFEKPNLDFVEENLKYIVLVGIGGDSLGTKAVYEALRPKTKIIFLETIDPVQLKETAELLNSLSPEEYLINAASKSGKTLETTTNLEFLLEKVPAAKTRLVVTAVENTPLYKTAQKLGARTITIPDWISGKFSVFSMVGLFPLACTGIDVESLLEGARQADQAEAKKSAERLFKAIGAGKAIHNLFIFEPSLASFGKWYEQLLSESLSRNGKGITPTTSIGTVDLHSKTQLDLGGPKDKLFTFLKVEAGKTLNPLETVKNALYLAAKKSYETKVPLEEIVLPEISEKVLGKLMQTKMLEVAFLAEMLGINPFGQPDVEEYKKFALQIITETLAS